VKKLVSVAKKRSGNIMRYRYALFADDRVECFEDTIQGRRVMIRNGAKAFSVHSFARELKVGRPPAQMWGDFHLFYESGVFLEFLASKLNQLCISVGDIKAYKVDDGFELIIPEYVFRGDIGFFMREQIDRAVRKEFKSAWPTDFVKKICGCKLSFTRVLFDNDSFRIAIDELLPTAKKCEDGKVSPLTELFFLIFFRENKHSLERCLVHIRYGNLLKCSVLDAVRKAESISFEEAKLLKSLVICKMFSFKGFLKYYQREELILSDDIRMKFAFVSPSFCFCEDVPSELEKINSKFKCHGDCGVTNPSALPFLSYPPDLYSLDRNVGGFYLNRDGVFVEGDCGHSHVDTKICPPIWVEDSFAGEQGEVGARAVVFYDVEGNCKQLVVDEMVVDSPKLFVLLREHGFECPTGKTEKGLLRKFLVQQYPRQNKREDVVAVEDSGWHKDGFVPPRSELKASSYKLKSVLIPPESACDLSLPLFDDKEYWRPEEELAAYFSLLAPLLGLVKHKGICFHFHGGREQQRDSILSAVNYAWGDWLVPKVCSADDLTKHVGALTKLHNDLPLCVREVGSSDKAQKKMRTFLRRYFLGRKGDNKPVRGVVVSTGEKTLTPAKDRRLGRWGYVYGGDILLIDIPVGLSNFGTTEKISAGFGKFAVHEIQKDKDQFSKLLRSAHKKFKQTLVTRKSSRVFSEIVRILSMIYCVERYLVGDNAVSDNFVVSDAALRRCVRCVRDLDFETSFFMQSAQTLNRACGQILSTGFSYDAFSSGAGASILSIFVETKSCIIIPADEFKKMWSDGFPFSAFTEWLKKKKVLVSFKNQGVCGVQHFPKLKKSVRSYKINKKRLIELTRG
jgi:hypothetical protein